MSFAADSPALEQREARWWIVVRERLFPAPPSEPLTEAAVALNIKGIVARFLMMRRFTKASKAPSTKRRDAEGFAKTLRKAAGVLVRVPEAALALEDWPRPKGDYRVRGEQDEATQPILEPSGKMVAAAIAGVLDSIADYILNGRQTTEWLDYESVFRFASDGIPDAQRDLRAGFVRQLMLLYIQIRDLQLSEVHIGDHTTETGLVGFLAAVSQHPDIPKGARNGLSPPSLRRLAAAVMRETPHRSAATEKYSR